MRRKNQEIQSPEIIDQIIQNCLICRLGLCFEGLPYVVPISYGYDGEALYIHTAVSGKKIDMITQNQRVCFEMEDQVELITNSESPCQWSFSYRSLIGEGIVEELTEPEQKAAGLAHIMKHYSGQNWELPAASVQQTRVWKIQILAIHGKQSLDKVKPIITQKVD